MSLLSALKTDTSVQTTEDSLGGGSRVLDSGTYNCVVDTAYIKKAASDAMALVVTFKTDTGKEVTQTLWMTSGKDKGCKNYFEKDGVKKYLPGFIHANDLALLTVGKDISELDTETKVIKLYSVDAKAEVPTPVPMVTDLLGQEIIIGLLKQTVDKTNKNGAGVYVPTGETKEENELDRLFRASDKRTKNEIVNEVPEATFINDWKKKWDGQVRNKAKGAASGTAGVPKSSSTSQANKKPTNSLFG